jgi:hypothetical protein
MPVLTKPSHSAVLDALPQVGAQLTESFRLPTGAHAQEGAHTLQIRAKPEQGKIISVVNTLSSVDVVMFLQRLSCDDLRQLQQFGRDLKAHDLTSRVEHALLVERLAESFHLVQSKSILAVNFIGPETWRGVIKNQDARNKQSYANLPEDQRENLRSNVHSVARNLAALPPEALELIEGLRRFAPQGRTWVDPASSLADHVAKRAVERNHDAWRFRKRLEGNPHDDISKNVTDLDPRMRLFAGLMGLGTFQMLREAGTDAINALVRLGDEILKRDDLDIDRIRADIHSERLVVGVPFKDGSSMYVSPDLMAHFRDYHHGLWLTNRTLSWLLPAELHQPRNRPEHTPIEALDPSVANLTCIHIIALAASLAEDARTNSQVSKDLMTTAAPGNPFDLNAGLFTERGESL